MAITKNTASRCAACDEPLQHFQHSKNLPDGSQDDLCSSCKSEIHKAEFIRYKDYVWCLETEVITVSNMCDLD